MDLSTTSDGRRAMELTEEQIDRFVNSSKDADAFLAEPFELTMTARIMQLHRAHVLKVRASEMFPEAK